MRTHHIPIRVLATTVALAVGWRALGWAAAEPASEAWAALSGSPPRGGWTLEAIVTDAAAVLALLATSVLVLCAAWTILRELAIGAHASAVRLPTLAPSWWRRAVISACGLGLLVPAIAVEASASPTEQDPQLGAAQPPAGERADSCPAGCRPSLAGLTLPDWPLSAPDRSQITVRRGDSLWLIATELAGRGASTQRVADLTFDLYAANRGAIGPNPDVIHTGTILTIPGGSDDRGH